MSQNQSIFLQGEVIFKKTEKVIIYVITDEYLYLIDNNSNNKNDKNYKFKINDISLDSIEQKDIELHYGQDSFHNLLHFFTPDENEIFQYAIKAHKDIVKKEINSIIIDTVNILKKQKINKDKRLIDSFPFKETKSLHDILVYLLYQFQTKKTYSKNDGFPITISPYLSQVFDNKKIKIFYVLAGSFLSKYLCKIQMDDETDLQKFSSSLSKLFKKWINIAYIPSDFCYFYNRIQNLFMETLSKFKDFEIKPKIKTIVEDFKDCFKGLDGKKDKFPLMAFERLDYTKNSPQKITNKSIQFKSTYLYYSLKNSNFIYKFLSDKENEELKELNDCYSKFTEYLIDCFNNSENQKELDLYFIRFKLLFSEEAETIDKAKRKYKEIHYERFHNM